MVRFLHAADLHLGLRITRFGAETNGKVREARFEALDAIIEAAQKKKVDFILIAGDLFDDNHVDSSVSSRPVKMFQSIGIPVYIISGNHDPLTPDSVWERSPWKSLSNSNVQLLRTAEPVEAGAGVTLLPCPVFRKTSLSDPTRWIPPREAGDTSIRIGVAHGSLRAFDNLPEDDHLIDRYVVDEKSLDYLALGHWHKPSRYPDRAGCIRTAYPGVHEPMRFSGGGEFQTGWSPYSNTSNKELFADDGKGRAYCVSISTAGATPEIEEIETGRLTWSDEKYELHHEEQLSDLIGRLAKREHRELQLLRLHLEGVLNARAFRRLDELEHGSETGSEAILRRYCWAELDAEHLHVEPDADELKDLVGDGILKHVFDRLRIEEQAPDESQRIRAAHSLRLLYQFAQEVHT